MKWSDRSTFDTWVYNNRILLGLMFQISFQFYNCYNFLKKMNDIIKKKSREQVHPFHTTFPQYLNKINKIGSRKSNTGLNISSLIYWTCNMGNGPYNMTTIPRTGHPVNVWKTPWSTHGVLKPWHHISWIRVDDKAERAQPARHCCN